MREAGREASGCVRLFSAEPVERRLLRLSTAAVKPAADAAWWMRAVAHRDHPPGTLHAARRATALLCSERRDPDPIVPFTAASTPTHSSLAVRAPRRMDTDPHPPSSVSRRRATADGVAVTSACQAHRGPVGWTLGAVWPRPSSRPRRDRHPTLAVPFSGGRFLPIGQARSLSHRTAGLAAGPPCPTYKTRTRSVAPPESGAATHEEPHTRGCGSATALR